MIIITYISFWLTVFLNKMKKWKKWHEYLGLFRENVAYSLYIIIFLRVRLTVLLITIINPVVYRTKKGWSIYLFTYIKDSCAAPFMENWKVMM